MRILSVPRHRVNADVAQQTKEAANTGWGNEDLSSLYQKAGSAEAGSFWFFSEPSCRTTVVHRSEQNLNGFSEHQNSKTENFTCNLWDQAEAGI